jgi:hypothetical protein
MVPFLAIHAKKGEKWAQSKRTAPPISNFENSVLNIFHLVSYCVQKGEKVVSYLFTFDYLQKSFEKDLQKSLQKQNSWCKRGPKCYK